MDHSESRKRKINPRDRANAFSLLTFLYTSGTFKKGFRNELIEDQLYEAVSSCQSKKCGDKLENQREEKKIATIRLIYERFGKQYFFLGLLDLIWQIFKATVETDAVSNLIGYFSPHSKLTKNDAYYYASVVLGINFFRIIYMHNYILVLHKFALKVRTAFSALIYRKALRLTPAAMAEIGVGNIVTLITKDVSAFESSVWTINDMWVGGFRTIYVSYLIYAKMGWVGLLGVAMLFVVTPLQIYLANVVMHTRLGTGKKTDERLQIMQETLSAIKIIKMYTWESYFNTNVTNARKKELKKLLKGLYIKIVVIIIGMLSSKIAFYSLIMIYIRLGFTTDAEFVFYILGCFRNLRTVLAFDIPFGMGRGAEMIASLIRIDKVLNAAELPTTEAGEKTKQMNLVAPEIELKNVSVAINEKNVLKDVNLRITKGLTIVTGVVGSGKSTLLKTILQEYCCENSGTITVKGSVSYASQDPWLFPSSIKQNIIFGQELNENRYQEVVKVCALRYDLDLLEQGDETIVSDKGMNLSKGQQARINLARAVYKDSDIYLIDDSLTALDSSVQQHVFRECFQKYLTGKIIIMVSQCDDHLSQANNLIILNGGSVCSSASKPENGVSAEKQTYMENLMIKDEKINIDDYKEDSKLIEKIQVYHETKKEGKVNFSTYLRYIKYGGGVLMFVVVLTFYIMAQFVDSTSSTLLTNWVDLNQKTLDLSNNTDSSVYKESLQESSFTLNMYSVAVVTSIMLDLIKYYTLLNFSRVASLNIHKAMSNSIINASMSFFDNHFIGNILNRFTQDLTNIDEELSFVLGEVIRVAFDLVGIITVISYVNWVFLVPALIFLAISAVIKHLYMPTGRSLKRLEATTRSPLLGHLNSSLEGLTTIRAFKAQHILKQEFDRHQDLYTSAHFMSMCVSRAFGFIIDSCCTFLIAFVITRFLFFDSNTSAGDVGLVISQLFMLSDDVQWGIRQWAEVENLMTSVERLLEYTEIKEENKTSGQIDIEGWPKAGSITFKNVSMKCGTGNREHQVLKNVNFSVKGHEKVGIVGRTGAGKSSIISALFRLYDIEGSILIDSVDTKLLSIEYLRKNIAIIPQEPILFSGTIRSNIDPMNSYSDSEIWDALEKVQLRKSVESLDFEISNRGSSFSSGQRQLICLARAIIRNCPIVVLDEATANMDAETDALLHQTITRHFSNCTLLIIAHRLHSIIDSNKILLLDKGQNIEFDTPSHLLSNKQTSFYKLMHQCD
ncbi:unnamed protein product [Brassicogethes aeneus]|uniref:Multidrug resistance-associated protein lethal(2)03659 n=1 Tax=Brassicogethes aeneus TaxID=1431903 RepID=A0A9P0FKI8_BRAAE|nr:unnamed protein product [Brassicogethes aeneus]